MALPYELRVEETDDPGYVLVTQTFRIREVGCPMIVNPWLDMADGDLPVVVVVRNIVRVEDAPWRERNDSLL